MPQINTKVQITGFTGMNGGGWTPVICPIIEARRISLFNPDFGSDIEVTTDTADVVAIRVIAPRTDYIIEVSTATGRGFELGKTIAFLRGAGDQPKIQFEG